MIYRIIIFLFCVNMISSCSVERHLKKAQKHLDIAKRKGAVIKADTVWNYEYAVDTIWNTTNNTFETRHVVKDSFPYTITNTVSAGMTKQERKYMEKMFRHMERMMKLQNDSLKLVLKAQTKQHKQTTKKEKVSIRRENSKVGMWIIFAVLLLISVVMIKFNRN